MALDIEHNQSLQNISELDWEDLLYSIEQQKCIVVVGPEVFSKPDESTLDKRLVEFLKKQAKQLRIRVYDNGWFHLQPLGNETSPVRQVKEFYNHPTPHADNLLSNLARIRFPIYISLTPDSKLRKAFAGQPVETATYIRHKPCREDIPVPTADRPLVYQLLGNIEDRNSLVLTYDDFYDYLRSVFSGKSMSPIVKDAIIGAEYFLFLGIPFEQWYMHLFMRILNQTKEKLQTQKLAIPYDTNNADSCTEQYTIKFVDKNIEGFVSELLNRCTQSDNSFKLLRPNIANNEDGNLLEYKYDPIFLELEELVMENKFDDIYDKVKRMLAGTGEMGRGLLQLFIQLKSRNSKLEEENSLGILHHSEYLTELSRVRKGFIDQLDSLRKQWPNLSARP